MTRKHTMQTCTGAYFDFIYPHRHDFKIEEIAHHLSHLCRYTGACKGHYSVAQHSVMVSLLVPPELALDGLLHDASEAYLGDVSSPLKALLPDYRDLEWRVEQAIARQYGTQFPLNEKVKDVDMRLLMTEKRDLMPTTEDDVNHWPNMNTYKKFTIKPMPAEEAKALFLARYDELTEKVLKKGTTWPEA